MSEYDLIRALSDLSPEVERLFEEESETYSRGFTAHSVFPVLFGYLHELRENIAESLVYPDELKVILDTIQARFLDGDAAERRVIEVSFLERILGADVALRPYLPPSLAAEVERMERQRRNAS